MNTVEITLPDGSKQSVAEHTRPIDVAKSISPRLASDAIVARVNGELFDLTRPLERDARVEILTTKNPEALQVYRHSTAHLLAAAVLELFPETKLGIGPPTDSGFYYDGYAAYDGCYQYVWTRYGYRYVDTCTTDYYGVY